jgi:hypothetical protein
LLLLRIARDTTLDPLELRDLAGILDHVGAAIEQLATTSETELAR